MGPRSRRALVLSSSFLSGASFAFAPVDPVELRRSSPRDPRQDAARLASDFAKLTSDMRVAVARETDRGES